MASVPELVRLCPHTATRTFQTEHPYLYLDLRAYAASFDDGDETLVYTLVDDGQVVGYVAISDQEIWHPELGRRRCFALPAMAVDDRYQHSNAALRLVVKARRILDLRQAAHLQIDRSVRYDGIACVPWTDRLRLALERLGFEPMQGQIWWFRPWEPDEDDDP
ncbi:MAG TPA: hypothetical protein VHC45_06570 [Gaiellaceae bacterium]|jgi:hypothetical protein|nr:hypothetical protein [Gaiellaceae bacterium]